MKNQKILILGGYGNAGLAIARLLAMVGNVQVILAGRNIDRAVGAASMLNTEFGGERYSGVEVDAASKASLLNAFSGVNIVVVASSTIEHARIVIEAALDAGIDYFDVQIATKSKHDALEAWRERIQASGRCFITDGGFRPGIPAALVRYAACRIAELDSASVASTFQLNWRGHQFSSSSAAEFSDEMSSFRPLVLKEGAWKTESMWECTQVDFGDPFGTRYCMPMFMEEFAELPEAIPTLKNTGFYSSGFGGIVDYLIIPAAMLLSWLSPRRTRKLIGSMVEWGLKHTTCPPYGASLQMNAHGCGGELRMKVFHDDAYFLTAASAAACLFQYLDRAICEPGLWRQARLVEPERFFADLESLGVQIACEFTESQAPNRG